jgi:hypothetical protein
MSSTSSQEVSTISYVFTWGCRKLLVEILAASCVLRVSGWRGETLHSSRDGGLALEDLVDEKNCASKEAVPQAIFLRHETVLPVGGLKHF